MVARCAPIYLQSPQALETVAWIGLATAFFSATIGMAQNDIKKVFAYSTISQLGYMFLGLGTGAFSAGIFHLMTHAFFKALLFLGAGSVIHALPVSRTSGIWAAARHPDPSASRFIGHRRSASFRFPAGCDSAGRLPSRA
jgi:NADH-quinone oxidoreductase subunit L